MTDIRGKIQLALDTALYADKVFSFWNRKVEVVGENKDEYIVYTLSGDTPESYADNSELIKLHEVTIRYYYRDTLPQTSTGRTKVKNRETQIVEALRNADFEITNVFDAGDIDNVGFFVTLIECQYWEVV
jgi:hypothetical protein